MKGEFVCELNSTCYVKDIFVLANYKSVKLVMLILLTLFERCFYLYKLITFPY